MPPRPRRGALRVWFEHRLDDLIAAELDTTVEYTWWASRRGFVRNTLNAGACGIVTNVVGYSVLGDYGTDSPPSRIVTAVAAGEGGRRDCVGRHGRLLRRAAGADGARDASAGDRLAAADDL